MKRINKYLNILNIVEILFTVILPMIYFGFVNIYTLYSTIIKSVFYISLSLNIICGIINIIKKNKLLGILSIIVGIIPFITVLIKYTDIQYTLSDALIGIIMFVINCIILIISIINLIINRKTENDINNKIPLIIILLIDIVVNVVLISIATVKHTNNVNNFEKALNIMQNEQKIETYIMSNYNSKNKEYIFIDKDGREITKKQYDKISSFNRNFMVNNNPVSLACAEIDKNSILVNSVGEEIFTISEDIDDFIQYMIDTNKYNLKRMSSNSYDEVTGNNIIAINYNTLERYQEKNKAFEYENNYTYMYFKNSEFLDNVLQVVIKPEKEDDNKLLEMYEEFCDYAVDIDEMSKYYNYKKEFYLINFENNNKIKLECNNLIYEARYRKEEENIESIILCSNGNIPFYDKTETGYFNKEGVKAALNQSYVIYDVTDKYIIVNEKATGKTYILSTQTGKTIKIFDNTLIKYEGFYISYPNVEDGKYELIDKNLNVLVTSEYEPDLIGENIINISDLELNSYIYYCYNGNLKKLYYSEQNSYDIFPSQKYSIISSNIYSNINIIRINE